MKREIRFDGHNDFLPHQCEVSDVWESRKDWVMRFDPREHPEWMRKQSQRPQVLASTWGRSLAPIAWLLALK